MAKRKTIPIKTRREVTLSLDVDADERLTRKVTLSLDVDADERLTIQARRNGVTRSKLASELVGKSLAHIVVSIRGQGGQTESAA